MDRQTIYYGQLPRETDLLGAQQNIMVALAKIAETTYGTATLVDGFTVTPTTPASLNVLLTPGQIYQLENLEATAWSSLSPDTSHSIAKQGVLLDAPTIGITPPGTVGYSQVFLIEVQYQDEDTGSLVLPYYNSAVPTVPFSGPANNGQAQNTMRKGIVAYQIKAGVAAASGTQIAPTADAGWTGIYTITVANGATTVTSGDIAEVPTAPFLTANGKLPNIPAGVQGGDWIYGVDTSNQHNVFTISLTPPLKQYRAGTSVIVKPSQNVTGATVVNINGLGNVAVVRGDGSPVAEGDGAQGELLGLVYDGANFQLAWRAGDYVIDSHIVKTVHGAGADFGDLPTAFEWLGRYRITPNGFVTFQLAAGKFTYSSEIIFAHPDGDRVQINGANMLGAVPKSSDFAANGNSSATRAADAVTNLAMLRGRYATELAFTNLTAGQPDSSLSPCIFLSSDLLLIINVLITSDGTGNGDGVVCSEGQACCRGVTVHGTAGRGFIAWAGSRFGVEQCSASYCGEFGFEAGEGGCMPYALNVSGTGADSTAVGCGSYGVYACNSAGITQDPNGLLTIKSCAACGIVADSGSSIQAINAVVNGCANDGIFATNGSFIDATNAVSENNTGNGFHANLGSTVKATGSTGSGNTSFGYVADGGQSLVVMTGGAATGTSGASSPVANAVGNGNSYTFS